MLSGITTESNSGVYSSVLYSRYTLYAFLVYLAAWNATLSRQQLMVLVRVVAMLFCVQILVSL